MKSDRVGRDWAVISQIKNPFLRLAMATMERGPELEKLIVAFQFVTDTGKDEGAIPLSEILRRSYEDCRRSELPHPHESARRYAFTHSSPIDLPVQEFSVEPEPQPESFGPDSIPMPKELEDRLIDSKFGDKFEWNGHPFVVLEWNDPNNLLYFVPADCVIDDLPKPAATDGTTNCSGL